MQPDTPRTDLRPVLVVEDSDDDFDTVVSAAARAKVPNLLVRAADAESARRLLGADASSAFAFMLLDYHLQGLDGLALLEQLGRDGSLAGLPVVVFTTSVNPLDRDVFFEAGASAFHVKSVQHADCLGTLQSIFGQWLNRSPPPKDAAAPSAARSTA